MKKLQKHKNLKNLRYFTNSTSLKHIKTKRKQETQNNKCNKTKKKRNQMWETVWRSGRPPLPEAPLGLPWSPRSLKCIKQARLFAFSKVDPLPEAPLRTPPDPPQILKMSTFNQSVCVFWESTPSPEAPPGLPLTPPPRSLKLIESARLFAFSDGRFPPWGTPRTLPDPPDPENA